MKKFREIREGVNEISKGMVGRYLKKAPASAADGGRDSVMGSGKEKQGVKKVVNRITGTRTAVDKMTGKAKVPATEDRRMGSITVNTDQERKDRAARARAKMNKKQKEDSDAVKAFLAKGGKIKKLPPAKAQGYHGKDDPGKGMHGMMDKPDTRSMGTRKRVRSMR